MNENSYMNIPMSLVCCKNYTMSARITLAMIISLSRAKGYCYASDASLAELLGISERTVTSAVKALRESGAISVKNNGSSKHIFINYSALRELGIRIPPAANSALDEGEICPRTPQKLRSTSANSADNKYNNKYNYNKNYYSAQYLRNEYERASYDIEELEKIR